MADEKKYLNLLQLALEDIQAQDITIIDVRNQTTITDYMVICTGRSSRHVKAVAEAAFVKLKSAGLPPLSQNGLNEGEWALIDFGDMILHVMQKDARAFYNLEELWHAE